MKIGSKHTQETLNLMSKKRRGSKHWNWQGGSPKLEYDRVHRWIKKLKGLARKCEECDSSSAKRYHWSNKSGKYLYDETDWWQLCDSCHKKYDGPWNKGLKGRKPWHNTEGLKLGGWNKGKSKFKKLRCEVCHVWFKPTKSSNRFCSKGCATKSRYLKTA